MKTSKTIRDTLNLKTMSFDPELVLGYPRDGEISSIDDFHQVFLFWGEHFAPDARASIQVDPSRGAVRRSLHEAIAIARSIEEAQAKKESALDVHLAIFERIRGFATRAGGLWGVSFPDPLPGRMDDRKLDGSMLQWHLELLDLLNVYELLPAASGKREQSGIRDRISYEKDGRLAVYSSKGGHRFGLGSRDERITIQLPWEPSVRTVEPWRLLHGRTTDLAWVILTQIVTAKLNGRLNLGLDPSMRNSLAVTPNGIGPTLFARVWLDALNREADTGVVRRCQRPDCENVMPEGARADAQYCSSTCQKADRRRLLRFGTSSG